MAHTTHTNDSVFDNQIKQAFDEISLSAEAEQRILNNVMAYAQQKDSTYTHQAATNRSVLGGTNTPETSDKVADTASGTTASVPTPTPKKRVIPWKVALPVAACLLLVLGVGVLVAQNMPAPEHQTGLLPDDEVELTAPEGETSTAPSDIEPLLGGAYDSKNEVMADMAYGPGMSFEPGYYNTEEYNDINEPGFISTSTRPLSTFAADVDTASYANLRRLINEGYGIADVFDDAPVDDAETSEAEEFLVDPYYPTGTIPKGAIRIEEMLNYFTYDYALPTGDDLFGTTVKMGDCPWNPDTKLLVMGFATNPEVGTAAKGRNLVFLVDVSGSMDTPDKLDLLQDSFATLTDQLEANDRISIVTYAGYEEVVLDGASGNDARSIQRAIDKLDAEGSTNGEAGIEKAYEIAQKHFIEGGVNRIILASDGDLNVGISSESDLHDLVESKRDTGVYLSVLGFGSGNYKDNKMEVLADTGNGNYHYIDCLEEAEKVLGTDLLANLVPLANDVKLQVEFNPTQVKGYRLIGYENRALNDEDFRDDEKDAGDIGPGHQLTVAYEIVPVDSKMDVAKSDLKYSETTPSTSHGNEWLTCTMRYQPVAQAQGDGFVVSAGDPREQSVVVNGNDVAADPGDDWRFAASVIEFGMVMRDSEYKGSSSFDSIEKLLSSTDLSNPERKEFQRLVGKAR